LNSGFVGRKVFEPNTVPPNVDIISAWTTTSSIRIHVLAEGGSDSYSPTVSVNNIPCTNLSEHPTDRRLFIGHVDLDVLVESDIVAASSTGATDSVHIFLSSEGPSILSVTLTYPTGQTKLKNNDIVKLRAVVENPAQFLEIVSGPVSIDDSSISVSTVDEYSTGFKYIDVDLIINGPDGIQSFIIRALDDIRSPGLNYISSNSLTIDNVNISISPITVTYPDGQLALKSIEEAIVTSTAYNFESIQYTGFGLTITNPNDYNYSKRVYSSQLFTYQNLLYVITARKSSNDMSLARSTYILVCNVPPVCTSKIDNNPARLRLGETYEVRFEFDKQILPNNFSISISDNAEFLTDPLYVNSLIVTRLFKLKSLDLNPVIFSNLVAYGESKLLATLNYDQFVTGGFVSRIIDIAPFANTASIGVSVDNISRVRCNIVGGSSLNLYMDTNYHFNGFTIVNSTGSVDLNGSFVRLLDTDLVGSNTTGLLAIQIEEI
jgi:hypothetical protein